MFNKPEVKAYTIVSEHITIQNAGSAGVPEADE